MSNETQQTAVDILCEKLAMKLGIPQAITFYIDHQEEIREAKEIEKEQNKIVFFAGISITGEGHNGEYSSENNPNIEEVFKKEFEEWYNKNKGGNK
jgi:hypothetical protein